MWIEQKVWNGDEVAGPGARGMERAQLVLVFGSRQRLESPALFSQVRERYADAHLAFASTAGEIVESRVQDGSVVATAIRFASTHVEACAVDLDRTRGSREAGAELVRLLPAEGLAHVLVLSDGLHVNGSALVQGMAALLPASVAISGGLAADGDRFERTVVALDEPPRPGTVVAVGLYGSALRVGCGCEAGWDPFGPERVVTRAEGNVVYEIDGVAALDLYRRYLGERAAELPASGLLFPLSVRPSPAGEAVVRTILAVDEDAGSLTFAGDLPEGSTARLMKASTDRLIGGAAIAARTAHDALAPHGAELAILISCVGRRMVLQQRVEEEVEDARGALGERTAVAGFYSYGEICPHAPTVSGELQNQTMAITALAED